MSDEPSQRRRAFLGSLGLTAAGLLAGCSSGAPEATETPSATPTPTSGGGSGGDETDSGGNGGTGGGSPKSRVDSYLSKVSNYDGTIVDKTGQDEVVVKVGAEGNGGNFAFAPPAVRISTGTTISWEWTGKGGTHNVVSDEKSDFEFDSGSPVSDASTTFTQTFDQAGVGLYYCEPHLSLGMKGAFIVE